MKVSTKGRYGLRALIDLTVHAQGGAVPLTDIAEREKISLNYLEQVFGVLRRNGIIKSAKETGRGCILAVDPYKLTAGEVLELLEGRNQIVIQSSKEEPDEMQKVIKEVVWDRIDEELDRIEQKTIGEMAEEYLKRCGGDT